MVIFQALSTMSMTPVLFPTKATAEPAVTFITPEGKSEQYSMQDLFGHGPVKVNVVVNKEHKRELTFIVNKK